MYHRGILQINYVFIIVVVVGPEYCAESTKHSTQSPQKHIRESTNISANSTNIPQGIHKHSIESTNTPLSPPTLPKESTNTPWTSAKMSYAQLRHGLSLVNPVLVNLVFCPCKCISLVNPGGGLVNPELLFLNPMLVNPQLVL